MMTPRSWSEPRFNFRACLPRSESDRRPLMICALKTLVEILIPILAIAAAGWWFGAAWVSRLPPTWESVDRVTRRQAICNGVAATCAGLAALLQLLLTQFPLCRAFG